MARITLLLSVLTALVALLGGFRYVVDTIREYRWRKHTTGKWLVVVAGVLSGLAAPSVWAACDLTTVQGQIDAASNGDTVTITPASCSATWTSQLSITGKYLTLNGNGASIERGSTTQPLITITVNASGLTRITNFTELTELDDSGFPASDVIVSVGGCTYSAGSPNASFRIDNITFRGDDVTHLLVNCHGRGLIDNNSFLWTGNNEVIHLWGAGSGSATGWTDDVAPGTDAAVYIEDNTFTNSASPGFVGGKTAQFYGSRAVYRFNTYDCTQIDVHGNTPRSGRWWEVYHNTFLLGTCNNVDKWYQIRGGSGYIFGDTIEAGNVSADRLTFWQDAGKTTGGCHNVAAGQDSVGTGKDQGCDPAYVWDTEVDEIGFSDDPGCACVVENEDYFVETGTFNGTTGMGVGAIASRPATCTAGTGGAPGVGYWATDEGEWWSANAGNDGRLYKCTATDTWTLAYTPYTYPHPLRGEGGGGGTTPSPIMFIEALLMIGSLGWHFRKALVAGVAMCAVGMSHVAVVTQASTKRLAYTASVKSVQSVTRLLARVSKE